MELFLHRYNAIQVKLHLYGGYLLEIDLYTDRRHYRYYQNITDQLMGASVQYGADILDPDLTDTNTMLSEYWVCVKDNQNRYSVLEIVHYRNRAIRRLVRCS